MLQIILSRGVQVVQVNSVLEHKYMLVASEERVVELVLNHYMAVQAVVVVLVLQLAVQAVQQFLAVQAVVVGQVKQLAVQAVQQKLDMAVQAVQVQRVIIPVRLLVVQQQV